VQKTKLPTVLCFGGQIGQTVRASRNLYDNCSLFRQHLTNAMLSVKLWASLPSIPDFSMGMSSKTWSLSTVCRCRYRSPPLDAGSNAGSRWTHRSAIALASWLHSALPVQSQWRICSD
jgi:hypothetical protein